MSQDIAHILEGWDFDPHELNVRVVDGAEGSKKIQMRIDLGLLQMEMDGRPDGKRPFGFESLLDYYIDQAKEFGEGYKLSSDAVEELFRERWQYYHRYLCLFHLNQFDLVVRDTERSLNLFRFIRMHAPRRRDQWRFDQYRPYVLMMNTRAQAMMCLQANNLKGALKEIDNGCIRIETFLADYDRRKDESECFELEFLHRWRDELREGSAPVEEVDPQGMDASESGISSLRTQLDKAIETEDYETAAFIRDQLRRLDLEQQPGET